LKTQQSCFLFLFPTHHHSTHTVKEFSMMKRILGLVSLSCSLALLATAGCAVEAGSGATGEDSIATSQQAIRGLSAWHGGNGTYREAPFGPYMGANVQAGGIIDAAYFKYCTTPHQCWTDRFGGSGGQVMPNMFCDGYRPYMVGIFGQAGTGEPNKGNDIGKFGIYCGAANGGRNSADLTKLPGAPNDQGYGAGAWNDTIPFEEICDSGLIVKRINVRSDTYLNAIQIGCGVP
jgi:hypothetical protein